MKNMSVQEIAIQKLVIHRQDTSGETDHFDLARTLAAREADRYELYGRHLNEMMVRVLQTIGFDVSFQIGRAHV